MDIVALIVAIAALVVSIYTAYSSQYSERDDDELSKQMSEVEKNICDKLNENDKRYSRDLIEIKNSMSAVQRQVEIINLRYKDSPIPQEHMRVCISQLYAKIVELEEQKLQLEARCADLKKRLQDAKQNTA